jgi:transcriptional antiterminator RfaH
VHTLPHREFEAANQLQAQRIEVFLPACRKTVRHARRFRTVRAAFFPRYLFVRLNPDRDPWRCINGTYGVSRIVMGGSRPAPVPVGVVEDLLNLLDGDGLISMRPALRVGQTVRILSGPFAEAIGQLVDVDENERVEVLLEMMGGRVSVRVAGQALAAA